MASAGAVGPALRTSQAATGAGAAQLAAPSTAELIKAAIAAERADGSLRKSVLCLLHELFDGSVEAMADFFDHILAKPTDTSATRPVVTIDPSDTRLFGELWRNYCKKMSIEQGTLPWERPGTDTAVNAPNSDTASTPPLTPPAHKTSSRKRLAQPQALRTKPVPEQVRATHRMRVRFVPSGEHRGFKHLDLDFETGVGIKLMCLVLQDPAFQGRERLKEIPSIVVLALLRSCPRGDQNARATREEYLRSLLAPRFRQDPFVGYQLLCPYVFELTQAVEAQARRTVGDESNKRLRCEQSTQQEPSPMSDEASGITGPIIDATRMVITSYLYFRVKFDPLALPIGKSETAFSFLMYFFEEVALLAQDAGATTLFMNMSDSHIRRNDMEIAAEPHVFELIFEVARDIISFIQYKYASRKPPAEPQGFGAIEMIYHSTKTLKTSLSQITAVAEATLDEVLSSSSRRAFHWRRCQPANAALIESELESLHAYPKASEVRNFRTQFSHCCAFVMQPGSSGDELRKSISHMNLSHPTFRMHEVTYNAAGAMVVANCSEIGNDIRSRHKQEASQVDRTMERMRLGSAASTVENLRKTEEVERSHYFCIVTALGQTYVLFSSPVSHQTYCNIAVMECLTRPGQVKLVPMYPLLLRQYAGVFGQFQWSPIDCTEIARVSERFEDIIKKDMGGVSALVAPPVEKVRSILVDEQDTYDSLWVFVKTLFYQLCSLCTPPGVRRMSDNIRVHVLDIHEPEFSCYRWLHEILDFVQERTDDYPFCIKPKNWRPAGSKAQGEENSASSAARRKKARIGVSAGEFGMDARQSGLSWLGEIVLCFLCLGAVHTLSGDTLERLHYYLVEEGGMTKHVPLAAYLVLLKESSSRAPESEPRVEEGEYRPVKLLFDSKLAYDLAIIDEAPSLEKLVNGGTPGPLRTSCMVINSLVYAFVKDSTSDEELRWDVITGLDCTCQTEPNSYIRRWNRRSGAADGSGGKTMREIVKSYSHGSSASVSTVNSADPSPVSAANGVGAKRASQQRQRPVSAKTGNNGRIDSVLASLLGSPNPNAAPVRVASARAAADEASDAFSSASTQHQQNHRRFLSREAMDCVKTHRMTNLTSEMANIPEQGLRNLQRKDSVIARPCDVYRGIEKIHTVPVLRQACERYAGVFCFDQEWDYGKLLIARGAGINISFEGPDARMRLEEAVEEDDDDEDDYEEDGAGGGSSSSSAEGAPKLAAGSVVSNGHTPAEPINTEEDMRRVYMSLFARLPLTASEPFGRVPTTGCDGVPRVRQPITYVTGPCETREELRERVAVLGSWRYELAKEVSVWRGSFNPLGDFLREVEWFLYKRTHGESQRDRRASTLSESMWKLDADRYVRAQLNSHLPVDFAIVPNRQDRLDVAAAASAEQGLWTPDEGLFSYLDQGMWVIKLAAASSSADQHEANGNTAAASSAHVGSADGSASGSLEGSSGEEYSAKLNELCRDYCNKIRGVLSNADSLHPNAEELREAPCVAHMLDVITKSKAEKARTLEAQRQAAKTEPAAPVVLQVTIQEEELIESGTAVPGTSPPAPTARSEPKPHIAPALMPPPPPRHGASTTSSTHTGGGSSVPSRAAASAPTRSMLKPAYDDLDSLLSGISTSSSMFSYLDNATCVDPTSSATGPSGGGGMALREKSRYTGPTSYYATSGSGITL